MKSPANLSRAALNLLNVSLMCTCVPYYASPIFVCKVTSSMKQELSLHDVFIHPSGPLRLKHTTSSTCSFFTFGVIVYKVGGFGAHEVNGFVDVCAPTNTLMGRSGKNP